MTRALSGRHIRRAFLLLVIVALLTAGAVAPAWADVTGNDDVAVTPEDRAVMIPVLANDWSDGSPPALLSVGTPGSGTAVMVGNQVRYTPALDYAGTDSFTYQVTADGFTDTATVWITVVAVNDAPVAAPDAGSTNEETPVAINLVGNDSDPDLDPVTLVSAGTGSHGTVTTGAGTATYTPESDFNGVDAFRYTITDSRGGFATGFVTVTVAPVNDAPQPTADAGGTPQGVPVTIDVLANDTDPDGDPLSVTVVSDPAKGAAADNGDGTVTYSPAPGFVGVDSFLYTVSDPGGATAVASVTVNVSFSNGPPVAIDDSTSTAGNPVTVNVLANDTDPDGDPLTVAGITQPLRGTAVLGSGGVVTYTPAAGFGGVDALTYTLSDGNGGFDTGTVTISVVLSNDAPLPGSDAVTTPEDTPIVIAVLSNDSDPNGDPLTLVNVTAAGHGRAVLETGSSVRYTPDADFFGDDSFAYTVADTGGHLVVGTVTVTVTPVNDPPVAIDDAASGPADVDLELQVLANDSDPEGDDLTAQLVSGPAGATLKPDGTLTLAAGTAAPGVAELVYEACDADACSEANVSIELIAPEPLPPEPEPQPEPEPEDPDLAIAAQSASIPPPPLIVRPVLTRATGIDAVTDATAESVGALLFPLALLIAVMTWVLTAHRIPFLPFGRKDEDAEEEQAFDGY